MCAKSVNGYRSIKVNSTIVDLLEQLYDSDIMFRRLIDWSSSRSIINKFLDIVYICLSNDKCRRELLRTLNKYLSIES